MNLKGLIIMSVFLLLTVATVKAEAYNITGSTQIYNTQYCVIPPFLTTPIDPKIACDTTGDNCIALIYDTCTTSGVRVMWSVDKFQSHKQLITSLPGSISSSVWLTPYQAKGGELYYDVEYYPDQRAFYMVFANSVYVGFSEDIDGAGPALPLPHIYTPGSPLVTVGQTYGGTISMDCPTETNYGGGGYTCTFSGIYLTKFQDNNATNLYGFQACQARKLSPLDYKGLFCEFRYDVTNTTTDRLWMNVIDINSGASGSGSFGIDEMSQQAFWTGTQWAYDFEGQVDYAPGALNSVINEDTLGTPQDDWNQNYFGGNLYYRNFSLPTVSGYIYSIPTTDFSSYGTASITYTEDSSVNETINQSDSSVAGDDNLFIWERKSGSDEADNGIWVYRQTNIPITIETDVSTPVSAYLTCNPTPTSSYSDSDNGDYFTLNTVCQNNNQIVFTNTKEPLSSVQNFDIPDDCLSGFSIKLKYADNPHDHQVTVKTFDENLPIPSATVDIDAETNTTNANGIAYFEDIDQISGTSLYRSNYSTCEVRLSTDGTGFTKNLEVTKTGYRAYTSTLQKPTKSLLDGYYIWNVQTSNTVSMRKTGMFLTVNVYGGGNTEINSCDDGGYTATVSGPDVIRISIGGQEILRDYATIFPAEFVMNHSSSPVNVSVILTTPDGDSYLEYVSMTYDDEETIDFDIERAITNLSCSNECDCPSSSCIDEYFYSKKGCISSICDYDIYDCILPDLCDTNAGCFNAVTEIPCSVDSDCNSLNYCLDTGTMNKGVCGSSGVCLNKTVTCNTFCNTTANVCEEQRLCLLPTPTTFRVGADSFSITCDYSNAGTTFCGASLDVGLNASGIPVLKSQVIATWGSIGNMPVSPDGWNYIETKNIYGDDIYLFLTPRITCSESCEMSIEFCGANGCDTNTGECIGAGTEASFKDFISWIKAWWFMLFPTIWDQTLVWAIISLVSSLGITLSIGYVIKSGGSLKGQEVGSIFLGSNIALFLVGSFIGTMPLFVGLVFTVLAGFLVWQIWR